jgi:lysozyme
MLKMKVSDSYIDKLITFESCKLKAYRDSGGKITIGIGHTKGVKMGQTITIEQAKSLCKSDLAEMERYVNNLHLTLTQSQFESLVDFTYNSGIGNLLKSSLLKKIRINPKDETIKSEFMKYAKDAKGIVQPGLVKRKTWEASNFLNK